MSLLLTLGLGTAGLGLPGATVISGPSPHFEVAAGGIDGVNKTFFTVLSYLPSTTAVFLNGQLLVTDFENGWVETDPAVGRFDLNEAPVPGDVVQIFYLDTTTSPADIDIVIPIKGTITDVSALQGFMSEVETRTGQVQEEAGLQGQLQQMQAMNGVLKDPEELSGKLREICEAC